MKRNGLIIILIVVMFQVSGQETKKEKITETQLTQVTDTNENIKVVIGEDLIRYEDSKDEVKVKVGNRGMNILESLEGHKVDFEKFTGNYSSYNPYDEEQDDSCARKRDHFKGHWSGIEFGFNNYLTAERSLVMPDAINYMTLHSGKSNNFNINFSQLSLGLTQHIGIVTGLGLNWNNYRFDGNNNILKGANGVISLLDPGAPLEKSKLTTCYLTVPVMLEIQIPADNHHLNLAAGFIGALKVGSHTKMVFQDGDKVKSNGDFSLNLLRYGATARVGYQNFQIYGTYYMSPLFKTGKGPGGYELYPFEIGFSFSFND
jgi:hypothetical protein